MGILLKLRNIRFYENIYQETFSNAVQDMSFLQTCNHANYSFTELQYYSNCLFYDMSFLQKNNHTLNSNVEALYNEHLLYELFAIVDRKEVDDCSSSG